MRKNMFLIKLFILVVMTAGIIMLLYSYGLSAETDFTKLGNKVVCPVSKGCPNFYITEDTPKVDYQGRTYFFHCMPCVGKFKSNPERYVERAALEKGTKMAPEASTY